MALQHRQNKLGGSLAPAAPVWQRCYTPVLHPRPAGLFGLINVILSKSISIRDLFAISMTGYITAASIPIYTVTTLSTGAAQWAR